MSEIFPSTKLFEGSQTTWQHLTNRVNSWLLTERMFLLIFGMILIYLLWFSAIQLPLNQSIHRTQSRYQVMQQEVTQLEKRSQEIVEEATKILEKNKQLVVTLSDQVDTLNKQITASSRIFLSAPELAESLRKTLDQAVGVKLLNLTNLPSKNLVKAAISEEKQLIQQGMNFTLQGGFFDTLSYIEKLEQSKIFLLWDDLKYHVTTYPNAEITITVFFLHILEQAEGKA